MPPETWRRKILLWGLIIGGAYLVLGCSDCNSKNTIIQWMNYPLFLSFVTFKNILGIILVYFGFEGFSDKGPVK